MYHVDFFAVVLSVVAAMVVGSVWYGPLFGKLFMKEMGMDSWSPEKQVAMRKSMGMSYLLQALGSFIMFYVLAGLIGGFGHLSLGGGVMTALILWAGFVVPLKLGDAIWGGNWKLFWLGIGNMFVTLIVAGAIIGAMG